jgi:uncharacterized protein
VRHRIASLLLGHRFVALVAVGVVTAFFAAGLPHVQIKTVFSDLLPKGHPYAETYRDHPNFGNPLTMSVMIKVRDGTIYNPETLDKVWHFTRDIDLAPAVDHDQVVSITTEKARYAEATPSGVDVRPLMDDRVPTTAAEVDEFRRRVEASPLVRDFLVSADESATIVNATFIEHRLDYRESFNHVQALVEAARDERHEVHLAGQPALTGWVFQYQRQMLVIFGVTLAALVLALIGYMRNVSGVLTPIITGIVSATWGFGLMGWLGAPIEPLLLLVPLLLVARAFSHTVQFAERYYEIKAEVGDKVEAAQVALRVMMGPGILGVVTDAAAIILIALAPIPAMERFALFCGFWTLMLIPTSVFLAPVLLTLLPAPRNPRRIAPGKERVGGRFENRVLLRVARLSHGWRARITGSVMAVVAVVAVTLALQIKIGNPVEGSNLLWHDSEFNRAVRAINDHFPGVNTLEIVLEGRDDFGGEPNRIARQAEAVMTMLRIQDLVERGQAPPTATLSFADYLMEGNRLFAGGHAKWAPLDPTRDAVNAAASAAMMNTSPVAFSHVIDFEQRNATVSMWYRDNRQETVDHALAQARHVVDAVGLEHDNFRIRMATGTIALQQAMNDVVAGHYWIILGTLNAMIFVICGLAYRSFLAGLILLVPVNLSNFVITASMSVLGIGLDINSLLVAAVGVGVGIDYGIYLLSRICEEYRQHDRQAGATIDKAVTTTGRAIMFTATIMLIGIMPWYFLSGLKFLADMGLLLSMVMVINMVMALLVLPLLIWFLRPNFIGRTDLFVTEEIYPVSGKTALA